MIKMVVNVYRKPGMTREAFDARWRGPHGDLVRRHAQTLGFVRYTQSHNLQSPEIEAFAAIRGWAEPSDGITQVWWANRASMEAAMGTAEAQKAIEELFEDEQKFVDGDRTSAFLSEDDVIFDYTNS